MPSGILPVQDIGKKEYNVITSLGFVTLLIKQKLQCLLCHYISNFLDHYQYHKADETSERGYLADVLTTLLKFPSSVLTVHQLF